MAKRKQVRHEPGNSRARRAAQARKKRRRTGKRTLHYLLLLIFVLSAGTILSLTVFFKIEEIAVVGADRYQPDEIIKVSGITEGENLLRLKTAPIEEEILSAFPYLESVSVQRKFPPRVEIVVAQSVPEAAVFDDDEVAFITLEGKLLEQGDLLVPPELPVVKGLKLEGCEPGKTLGGEENPDNEERLVMLRYLFDAARDVKFPPITNVDVTDRLNMKIVYEARLILELGSEADLEYKLTFLRNVIEEQLDPDVQARLDATNARDKRLLRKDGRVVNGEFIPNDVTAPDIVITPEASDDVEASPQ